MWPDRDKAAGWRAMESPARLWLPSPRASLAHPRGKPGFSTLESGCGRETDCLLEEAGFEPSVPRKAPGVPAVPALVRAVFRLEGSRRNRWFESGSLQQRVRTKPLTPRA